MGLLCTVVLIVTMQLGGCGGGGGGSSTVASIPDYGGSIPQGDYVTATISGNQVQLKNATLDTEETRTFSDFTTTGSSIVKKTESDSSGNFYYMFLVEGQVLSMQKMDSNDDPIGLPLYMFDKSSLSADNLKGRTFNFMEFFADAEASDSAAVEMGFIGFDTDADGRLYGAAFDSDGSSYSITDEDGAPDSGDEFVLSGTEGQADGSLVLWENGADNWAAATTLTGTPSGALVMDHGPDAGGGAGFAFPQVTGTGPDTFWSTVAGDYFLIHYDDTNNVEFFKCVVAQTSPGSWPGTVNFYSVETGNLVSGPVNVIQLESSNRTDVETLADFDAAQSSVVQDAEQGNGLFQEEGEDPDFFISFDPQGNYIGVVDLDGKAFAIGVRDRNWQ